MTKSEIEIIGDVVVRYVAHDQYGSDQKAIGVLGKRLNSNDNKLVEKIFKRHLSIYENTKKLVIKKLWNNPHFNDKLFDKIKSEISKTHDCVEAEAGAYINWCYYWYVLK